MIEEKFKKGEREILWKDKEEKNKKEGKKNIDRMVGCGMNEGSEGGEECDMEKRC